MMSETMQSFFISDSPIHLDLQNGTVDLSMLFSSCHGVEPVHWDAILDSLRCRLFLHRMSLYSGKCSFLSFIDISSWV
jgi:hypothetical protein